MATLSNFQKHLSGLTSLGSADEVRTTVANHVFDTKDQLAIENSRNKNSVVNKYLRGDYKVAPKTKAAGGKSGSSKPKKNAPSTSVAEMIQNADLSGAANKKIRDAGSAGDVGGVIGGIGESIAAPVISGAAKMGLLEDQGKDQTAQNAGQWLMNLLSTGTYVGARAAEGVGAATDKYGKARKEAKARGDSLGAVGADWAAIGEGTVNAVGGAARGLAEGVGARFDGQRPRTWGQNLEAAGTKKALQGALGEDKGNFAQGLIGTVADIGLDPATYLTLGATGALRGAKAGVKGAQGGALSKVAGGVKGGLLDGPAVRRAELSAEKAIRVENKAIRKAGKAGVPFVGKAHPFDAVPTPQGSAMPRAADLLDEVDAERAAADLAPAADEVVTPQAVPDTVPDVVPTAVDDVLPDAAPAMPAPRAAVPPVIDEAAAGVQRQVDELLPSLRGRGDDLPVPAGKILDDATVATPTSVVDEGVNGAILEAINAGMGASVERGTKFAFRDAMTALDANPKTKEFLDLVVRTDDNSTTVRELMRREVRFQSRPDGPGESVMPLIEQALSAGRGMESKITPEALAAAIAKNMPKLGQEVPVEQLLARLVEMNPAGQKKLLSEALNLPVAKSFDQFTDALDAAVAGRVDAPQMRSMLDALGIASKGLVVTDLRNTLHSAGRLRWDQVQASIHTVDEVLDAHGVTPELNQVADAVDVEQVVGEMVDEAAADMAKYVGFDATKIAPSGGSITGNAIHAAFTELGRLFKDGNPVNAYSDDAAIAMNKTVLQTLATPYAKMSGAGRADRIYPRYLEALTVIESQFRALGMIPRFADKRSANTLYVSFGQLVGNLPEDVAKLALFSPMRGRAGFAAEKEIGFVNGFTLYPNHLGNGTKLALRNLDNGVDPATSAGAVRALVLKQATEAWKGAGHKGVPPWASTTEGNAALDKVAGALIDPDYLARIRAIDQQMAPVAVALTKKVADEIVAPIGQRIIDALAAGTERGGLQKIIDDAWKAGIKAAEPAGTMEQTLLSDLVRQRLDHAIINGVLGENGALIVAADARAAKASARPAPKVVAETQARIVTEAKVRTKAGKGGGKTAANTQATRTEQATARVQTIEDAKPSIEEALDEIHPGVGSTDEILDGAGPVTPEEFAKILTYGEVLSDLTGAAKLFKHIAVGQSGKAGQLELHALRVSAEEASFGHAADYATDMRNWLTGLAKRLQPVLGLNKAASVDDVMATTTRLWEALSRTDPEDWGDEAAIRAALTAGGEMDAARNITGSFDALGPAEIDIAIELRQFINMVHNPEAAGAMSRAGLTTADVTAQGFRLPEEFRAFLPDPGEADLGMHAQIWRGFGQSGAPLDVLASMHQAISAAMVAPSIGAQLSHVFGHSNMARGVPRAQLYAEGWRAIDAKSAFGGVGKYVQEGEMFHPEIIKQLTYVNHYLESSRSFASNEGFNTFVVKPYDAVMHVLKSSNTIWRPGHHVTNVLGEFGMLLMAGVNPLQATRSIKAIRAGGALLDADLGPLTRTLTHMGAGQKIVDPRFAGDTVKVVIRDAAGKKTITEVSLQDLWIRAINDGSALTHTAARDLQNDLPTRLGSTAAQKFANENPLARADEALGKFSAVRDNVTRIAHYIHALEAGQYGNLDEAFTAAARKVQDYHPTMRTLSATEQKYNRRIFFFYSWVRQAISRVVRTALDNPGFVTMPSKAQYNMAEANGLEPESIGGLSIDDQRIAPYGQNTLLGPTLHGGIAPPLAGQGGGDHLWGYSMSSPQIDALSTLFSGATIKPEDGIGNVGNLLFSKDGIPASLLGGQASPLIGMPAAAAGIGNQTAGMEKDGLQTAFDTLGAPTALARSLPNLSGEGTVYTSMFPNSKAAKYTPEQQDSNQMRYLLNALTGMKFTDYTSDGAEKSANIAWGTRTNKLIRNAGITAPNDVEALRNFLKERQGRVAPKPGDNVKAGPAGPPQ